MIDVCNDPLALSALPIQMKVDAKSSKPDRKPVWDLSSDCAIRRTGSISPVGRQETH